LLEDSVIIAGPASVDLAKSISRNLNVKIIEPELKIFADGESKLRIQSVNNKRCIIVQSLYPPSDRHIVQLLMIIHKCKKDNASKITVIIPYMAYARQDKAFLDEEIISIDVIAKLIENFGVDEVITIDIHNELSLSYFSISIKNITAISLLADYIKKNVNIEQSIIVSPDKGGIKRAENFADLLKLPCLCLKKKRDRNTGLVSIDENIGIEVDGLDAILVDDMISTGESIVKSCKVLKKQNIRNVLVVCTHAILLDNAYERIMNSGAKELISTNSIPSLCSKVDISILLSNILVNAN
jgi:ribose-phosphate pyrophosphokinase